MLHQNDARLISFFINSSGYLVPRSRNEHVKISKTVHPYLLGRRGIYHFYNLEKTLYGIRSTMEVLKNIAAHDGKILLVSDSLTLQARFFAEANISSLRWKRGSLAKSEEADLVLLSGVDKENLVEAHRKCLLLVGVGSSTMSKTAYPFHLNVESPLLSDWFLGLLYATYTQGARKGTKLKAERIASLLSKGLLKKRRDGSLVAVRRWDTSDEI